MSVAASPSEATADATGTLCPVCRSAARRHFLTHRDMTLQRCTVCGTIYLDPLPTPAAVTAMYTDAYDNATTSYFAKVEKKMRRARRRVAALARRKAGGRFLDIGCSGGFMVEAARERGFEAFGLDIDPVSIAYAKRHYPGNAFLLTTAEDYAQAAAPFDLVYSSEVIEHVPDSRRFAAAVATLLKPGGWLYLTTPDISHWRRPKDVTRWDGFCPPAHCVYFTPASLARLMTDAGLQVVRRSFAFKPGIKLLCRKPA